MEVTVMPNEFGKSIDKTYLSIDKAEERGFLHRDYIAHCLRWSHVCKYLQEGQRYKAANILDIGCGKETPLLKTLYSSRLIPRSYFGVDYGPIYNPGEALLAKVKPTLVPETDILNVQVDGAKNVITCFEMLEHVEPMHAVRVLQYIKDNLSHDAGARAFISTPNYNPHVGAAANHVNEMTFYMLGYLIESVGLYVKNFWGTFASIRDYRDLLPKYNLDHIFEKLREYYDVNYLATIFAPLFPAQSRNVLWELRHVDALDGVTHIRTFPTVPEKPWGSSDKWQEVEEWLGTLRT
jgi:hypothetical protein